MKKIILIGILILTAVFITASTLDINGNLPQIAKDYLAFRNWTPHYIANCYGHECNVKIYTNPDGYFMEGFSFNKEGMTNQDIKDYIWNEYVEILKTRYYKWNLGTTKYEGELVHA